MVFVVRLLPTLKSLIESRSFKIAVGAFEISAQEASNQLAAQIKDLQDKMVVLENSLGKSDEKSAAGPPAALSVPVPRIPRLSWVDDREQRL